MVLLGCQRSSKEIASSLTAKLVSINEVSEVGNQFELQFNLTGDGIPMLLLENSYGPKLFKPEITDNIAKFVIPEKHTYQSGRYDWKLLANLKLMVSGSFHLRPKGEAHTIETYFGPRSIRAGGKDYSMLVAIPTDIFDNPISDSTKVNIMQQMDNETILHQTILRDGFAWQLLYSGERTGRMLVGASTTGARSKELTSMISPSNATDFIIEFVRVHEFADGNQVIDFRTSVIQDEFGNTIGDGTFVNFIVQTKNSIKLQTSGNTLAGVATGRMLHPTEADQWQISAFVTGEAKSNTIVANFKPAVTDFEVHFSKNNRQISVGPILGFMQQLVPDGLKIELDIYSENDDLIATKTGYSRLGVVQFELENEFYPNGKYYLKLKLAGLMKEYQHTIRSNAVE